MKLILYVTICFTFLFSSIVAEDMMGRCMSVADGNTIYIFDNGQALPIKLDGIQAPEIFQANGEDAKKRLSELTLKQFVAIKNARTDKYGRTFGTIFNEKNENVNAILVRSGLAKGDVRTSDALILNYEALAKKDGIGIWNKPNPTIELSSNTLRTKDELIYIAENSKTYHAMNCKYVPARKKIVHLSQLTSDYTPCSLCNPVSLRDETVTTGTQQNIQNENDDAERAERLRQLQAAYAQYQYQYLQQPFLYQQPYFYGNNYAPSYSGSYSGTPYYSGSYGGSSSYSGDRTATGLQIYTGPRGGRYHISPKSGRKVYEKRHR